MALWAEITISVLLVIGGFFGIVGSFGLIRLKDAMSRLHAPTKATTLGVGGVLVASMVYFFAGEGQISAHELMITLFLFLTAPIVAHFIAKVHLHLRERPDTLPKPAKNAEWAGFAAETPARGVRKADGVAETGPGGPGTAG
ncbi:Na+/H+ antiporter subunit G [Pararhodobacter sp.]|jgi:multicomponent K+:H+ antiporter subunit G|uniref:Na+/H+ antiporter subunit G n=1 Tax=Pararhodobacter sp. TaxID=2127056 RepID=UPI002FDD0AA6